MIRGGRAGKLLATLAATMGFLGVDGDRSGAAPGGPLQTRDDTRLHRRISLRAPLQTSEIREGSRCRAPSDHRIHSCTRAGSLQETSLHQRAAISGMTS